MTASILTARGLHLDTPLGRPLIRDLHLQLHAGDRVAIVGRNGAGKSSLLRALAGEARPSRGRVRCTGSRVFIPQQRAHLDTPHGPRRSPGEIQRQQLDEAFAQRPDLLLLDEPTHDLDAASLDTLIAAIEGWRTALVVVSHAPRVLSHFENFFVVAESGCHHVQGSFEHLVASLSEHAAKAQARYVQHLNHLVAQERHNDAIRRRRERKKNLGRLHELGRCTSRSGLNTKRGLAQRSQTRRANIQRARIADLRAWAKATRRAMAVDLPLRVDPPVLPAPCGTPIVDARDVGFAVEGRTLFEGVAIRLEHHRMALRGPSGAGKTTLLDILAGHRRASCGVVRCDSTRIGYIKQRDTSSRQHESLLDRLSLSDTIEQVAQMLRVHRFPFALAQRPLGDLSPGEHMRAELLCLLRRDPLPELLILDQPTDHLDFVGREALESVLQAWTGGLLVVSHDEGFLQTLRIDSAITLG